MSIQIGTGSINLNNVTTTRERLILSSSVNSNLVQLTSSCNIVYVSLNDYVMGKSNQSFVIRQSGAEYLSLSGSCNVIYGDTSVTKTLHVSSNLNVAASAYVLGGLQSASALTSNMSIISANPITTTTPFLQAMRSNLTEAFGVLANGTVRMQGPVGIGTTLPKEALHVQGNILSSSNITSSTVTTTSIQGLGTNQFIRFQDKLRLVADNVEVTGNLNISGNLAFDRDLALVNLIAQEGIFGKRAYLYNDDPYIPTLEMVYDGPLAETFQLSSSSNTVLSSNEMMLTGSNMNSNVLFGTCNVYNVLDYTFHPLTYNVSTLSMDTFGRLGMGTRTPDAVLDIAYQAPVHQTNNLLKVRGTDASTVITKESCIGVGTEKVHHCLHVDPPVGMGGIIDNPLVGLYGPNVPFLAAYSNNTPVYHINEKGWLSINKALPSNTHLIDVEGGPVRFPVIDTEVIRGYTSNCNIDFEQTTLSNIKTLNSCNLIADELYTHAVNTNFMYSSNISVVGFKCFSWSNLFSISLSNFWLSGAGALMAESDSELQTNHRQEGKLKIVLPTLPADISRAIYAKGQYSTSVRIHSTDENVGFPYLELSKGSYTGQIFVDNEGSMSFRSAGDDDPRFKIINDPVNNILQFHGDTFSKNGDIGIHTLNGPEHPLDVVGNTRIRNGDLDTILYIDTGTSGNRRKFVGISTDTPAFSLHVEGDFYTSLSSRFNSNLTIGGRIGIGTTNVGTSYASISSPSTFTGPTLSVNSRSTGDAFTINNATSNIVSVKSTGFVGIGTSTPSFMLHVGGDLNFDGSLFEKGLKYISSQWTSRPNQDLWFSSNVGIGTTIPNYRLHVQGTSFVSGVATFGSNISSDGTVYAKGSFVSTSDRTLKTNLQPIEDALTKLGHITGYTYDRTDTQRRESGLVAQEVLEILPEVVAKDETERYTIAYGNMAGIFVQAFKEMQKEIDELKAQIAELKCART